MPRGITFSPDEYVLCTYAALYGDADLGGLATINLSGHPRTSVRDKVRNLATDMDGVGIARSPKWPKLTGRTTGMGPRYTKWNDLVLPHALLRREVLLERCLAILDGAAAPR